MRVEFTDIPKTGSRYAITDDAWFAETGLHRIAPVQAELAFTRKKDTRLEVRGFLDTGVRLKCDRCLSDYNFAVQVDFYLVLEVPAEDTWSIKELECKEADRDTVQLKEPVADFSDILRQQLHLSLPVKQICRKNCRGLCPQCGADLNNIACDCAPDTENSPFAALAALKK